MFTILLAGFNIQINNRYDFVYRQCKKYLVEDSSSPDLEVTVSDELLSQELKTSESLGKFSPGYCESICIYRAICHALPSRGAFMLHAAVIEYEGMGYAFSAKPGVGKSTHARLWCENLDATVINGDKPIITFSEDGRAIAWGTPWCGKEGLEQNRSIELRSIGFIERSQTNFTEQISAHDASTRLMTQLLLPRDPEGIMRIMALGDRLLGAVSCYKIHCNISPEAAIVSRDGITEKGR